MRMCPNCNELNGENRTSCCKCGASLGPVETYKKICQKCGNIYSQKVDICEKCGATLSVYTNEASNYNSSGGNTFLYIIAILFPLIGLILGCIYIARGEDELGKSLLITGVVTDLALIVLAIMFFSCTAIY